MIRRPPLSTLFPYTTLFRSRVIVCGPPTLVPTEVGRLGVEVAYRLDDVLPECDVLNLLRRSEEHTSELQSRPHLVCRLLLEKKKNWTVIEGSGRSTEAEVTD